MVECTEIIVMKRGFTLFELLIVITLILIITSISVPWASQIYVRSQLAHAGQTLQKELYEARLEAMKAGTPFVFRFQSENGLYEIMPKSVWDSLNMKHTPTITTDVAQTRTVGTSEFSRPDPSTAVAASNVYTATYRRSLPNQFIFQRVVQPLANQEASYSEIAETRAVGTGAMSYMENTAELQQVLWSEPIVFFPNGRTTSASVVLFSNEHNNYRCELSVRGLTGTARVGKVTVAD